MGSAYDTGIVNFLFSRVCEQDSSGIDCGDQAADWFTRFLKKPVRLAYCHPSVNTRIANQANRLFTFLDLGNPIPEQEKVNLK